MKKRVAIVIPYYHETLTEIEMISFRNCLDVFKDRYPIILVTPERIRSKQSLIDAGLIYEFVPDIWMENVESYNRMMLSVEFYCRFLAYEYILIFQLDAFAFSDSLITFCDYGYDYIGAPWLKGIRYLRTLKKGVWFVGNGGFSLRRVSAFLSVLRTITTKDVKRHEDIFWASCDSEKFHVAPIEVALKFAFEQDVRQCFLRNQRELPFGCHAWGKYDFDFWRPIFEAKGYYLNCQISAGIDNEDGSGRWNYEYLDAEPRVVKLCLDSLSKKEDYTVYVFGAGKIGEECCWLLQRIEGQRIICIDNDISNLGKKFWNISIESPDFLDRENDEMIILITDKNFKEEIVYQLNKKGFQYGDKIFFYDDLIDKIRKMY